MENNSYVVNTSKINRVSFTVTSLCNGRCTFCFNRMRSIQEALLHDDESISLGEYESIIIQALLLGLEQIELSGGEVLLNVKKTLSMIKFAKENGVRIGIFTNGTLLSTETIKKLKNSKIDFVRIGICGDEKTHAIERKTTPKEFKAIYDGIKKCIEEGLTTRLFVTVTKNTAPYINKTLDFLAENFAGAEHCMVDFYIQSGIKAKDEQFLMAPEQYIKTIDTLCKKIREHKNKLKIIPFYGTFPFLSKEYQGEEIAHSECGKTRVAVLPKGRVFPCLCTQDLIGDLNKEKLEDIAKKLPCPEYDYSKYAPCCKCMHYKICHDSACPSLTFNQRHNYLGPPTNCPIVIKYEELTQQGNPEKEALTKAWELN